MSVMRGHVGVRGHVEGMLHGSAKEANNGSPSKSKYFLPSFTCAHFNNLLIKTYRS